jgi:SAM-dependent methyltransferase
MPDLAKELERKLNIRIKAVENMGREDLEKQEKDFEELRKSLISKTNDLDKFKFLSGYQPITSNKRYIGPLVVFIKKALRKLLTRFWGWYINPILEQQNRFNLEVSQHISILKDMAIQLAQDKKKIDQMSRIMNLNFELSLLNEVPPLDYFDFENRFRGSREDIKKIQSRYVEYFKKAGSGTILDIGCGRGEFLELMKDNGITAKGIDVYPPFIHFCSQKGFNVEKTDALMYLKGLPNSSVGGIFMAHVAEHLAADYLRALIFTAYEKLRTGGYFIVETPNPACVIALTKFNIDFDHIKPVHYLSLEYLFSKANFRCIKQYNTPETIHPYQIQKLEGENIKNKDEFNDGIEMINKVLFGYRDYTLIAQK